MGRARRLAAVVTISLMAGPAPCPAEPEPRASTPLAAAPTDAAAPARPTCALEAGPERAVVRVLDAATLRLDDGKDVRLAGILAPLAVEAGALQGDWPPEAAAYAALATLVEGQTVALAFAGRREDRWGRVLAHLLVRRDGAWAWVQGHLVDGGHARVHPTPDDAGCARDLLGREQVARAASRGLWANAAYQVRPADRPTELARWRGTFQLVRGTVARVSGTRTLVTVDLTSSETGGPAAGPGSATGRRGGGGAARVVWRRTVDAGLARSGRGIEGATVLVRGWIDARAGPEIEIVAAGQIELE